MGRVTGLAVALLSSMSPAVAAPADGALAALLACDDQSMARIAETKGAFGPVNIESKPGSRPGATYELDEATFAAPVEASGLHLYAFVRYVVFAKNRAVAISFAFRTIEDAPTAARMIGPLMKDVDSQEQNGQFGWLVELEPEWHTDGDGSAVEHRHPLRLVHISPTETAAHKKAAMIECGLAEARVGKVPPPKLTETFVLAPPDGRPR